MRLMPMHGPSLAETTAFVAVVELKSFTKAAKQLALSPPRVSEMVRNLEDRLGVRLVERTTRSVAPTAAGERLLARLRPALDEYQAAQVTVLDEWAPTPVTGFFLYYPSRRQMRPALKALVDFLRKERRGASLGASQ